MAMHLILVFIVLNLTSCSQRLQESATPSLAEISPYFSQTPKDSESIKHLPLKNQQAIVYRWAKDYEKKNDNQKACQLYRWLDQQQDFVSPEHVLIGLMRACPLAKAEVFHKVQQLLISTTDHWSREDVLRSSSLIIESIDDSKKNNIHAEVLYHLADYETNQDSKISTLQKALDLSSTETTQLQIQNKLETVAPRFITKPLPEQLFSVARDFERARDFNKARSHYQTLLKIQSIHIEEKLKAYDRIGLSYKVQRSREAYLKELGNIEREISKLRAQNENEISLRNRYLVDHQITRARAIWTANNREGGRQVLLTAQQSGLANNDQMAQIHFVLGAMEMEKTSPVEAQEHFKKGIEFQTSDTKIAELLYWSLGWSYYQAGNFQETINAFSDAAEKVSNPAFVSKVKFWQAQSHLKLKENRPAAKIFREITSVDPYSFYSFLSKHVTQTPFRPIRKVAGIRSIDPTFEWLIVLDEKKSAKARLEALLEKKALDHPTIIQAFYRGEMYKEAIFHFGRNQNNLSQKEQLQLIPFIYPLAHLDLFEKYSNEFSFPIELSLSITRQESAFDPDARSWADAFGLMQLIPERAQQLTKELGIEMGHFSDLYNPDLNIKLGSYLLAKLYRQYNKQYPFNIAAYNAGERPVNNWRTQRYKGDTLEFIESIPYQETQNYVKLILRNKVIYKKLLSEKNFSLKDLEITSF